MNSYNRTIELRLQFVGVLAFLLVGILFWRMFNIQIIEHGSYLSKAVKQQRFEQKQVASRGKILVHDSSVDPNSYYPLAFDIKKFYVSVTPFQVKDKDKVASLLEPLLGISKADIFAKINNNKFYIPPLKKGLSQEEATSIENANIPGVSVSPEYSRLYPEGSLASHILGFVNGDGQGNYGFEQKFNNELKGKDADVYGERDAQARIINLFSEGEPQDGTSYVLTVDRSVQYFVEKKLKQAIIDYQADAGAVIVMDIKTGGIVAMANMPDYDPNNFTDQANKDPSLFNNLAISGLYEPGSIFKPLVMSAAIDQGVISPETIGNFDWHIWVDGYEIKTAERKAFGEEDMTQVLQNSDNVGMVWVSEKLGKENMYKYLQNFSFFDKTGIDLSGEISGYTKPLKQWRDVNRATISFGQGIAVTPLQIVSAYATLANGGKYIYPRVVDKIIYSDGTDKKLEKKEGAQVVSRDTASKLGEMLYNVVEKGHSRRAKVAGYKVGAKTGTAQIPKKDGTGYEESEDGLGIYVHSLAGFAPIDDPRYAMLVKLDRPRSAKYAESTAAPLFGEISSFLLNYYYRIPAEKTTQ